MNLYGFRELAPGAAPDQPSVSLGTGVRGARCKQLDAPRSRDDLDELQAAAVLVGVLAGVGINAVACPEIVDMEDGGSGVRKLDGDDKAAARISRCRMADCVGRQLVDEETGGIDQVGAGRVGVVLELGLDPVARVADVVWRAEEALLVCGDGSSDHGLTNLAGVMAAVTMYQQFRQCPFIVARVKGYCWVC